MAYDDTDNDEETLTDKQAEKRWKVVDRIKELEAENARLRGALEYVAQLGDGINPDMIDWANCGKIAKHKAEEALGGRE